jgi:hypothetical protein
MKGLIKGIALLALIATAIIISLIQVPVVVPLTENQTNVTVTVAAVTQIRVLPKTISFSGNPGQVLSAEGITTENIGSTNITGYYAYVDTITAEPSRPYGTGVASNYAAGGVLTLDPDNPISFSYLGRQEWNWTEDIAYKIVPVNTISFGFFRNTTSDYFWSIHNTTSGVVVGGCANVSVSNGVVFRINNNADNGTSVTRTTDTGGDYTQAAEVASNIPLESANWGIVKFSSGPLNGYFVALKDDCQRFVVYRFDRRFGNNGDFINSTAVFSPGDIDYHQLSAWLPYGIPAGSLRYCILTVEAS